MALNPNYMLAPSLQEYFVDKTTGLPLAGGYINFYSDSNRNVTKPIYTLSGSYLTGYSFVPLANPVHLSAVGTMTDNAGNDIIPYYYPFADADGTVVDNYYVEIFNSQGTLQETRQAWPNISTSGSTNTGFQIPNFVPNGQFLFHNNIPATYNGAGVQQTPAGQITGTTTELAQGGWEYIKNNNTSIDNITFPRFAAWVSNPTSSPRYSCQIICSSVGSETNKYLSIKIPDVNKFASDTQEYTFGFTAISNIGNLQASVIAIKNFGTGGNPTLPPVPIPLDTVTITGNQTPFVTTFTLGNNSAYTLGTNDDDYLQIVISLPIQLLNVQFTDFFLFPGKFTTVPFPVTTNGNFLLQGLANTAATPATDILNNQYYPGDGSNLYLPMIMTQSGLTFDKSEIGKIYPSLSATPQNNELLCDGSQYFTSAYSPLGIPYARLQKFLFDNTSNAPIFGTGANFVNAYINSGNSGELILITNKVGAQTNPADGTSPTGFNFTATGNRTNTGAATFNYLVRANSQARFVAIAQFLGQTNGSNGVGAGTSGMSVSSFSDPASAVTYYQFTGAALSAAALSTGGGNPAKYFTFSNASTNYSVWFNVAGETTVGIPNTLIQCNLTATMQPVDVATIIAAVISGYQTNTIDVSARPPAGSYFTFTSNGQLYAVWYSYSGASAPSVPGAVLIPVVLTGTENAAQSVTATQKAINSTFFAVPDLSGMFLRGTDPNGEWDTTLSDRWSNNGYYNYLQPGTYEFAMFANHTHSATTTVSPPNVITPVAGGGSFGVGGTANTSATSASTSIAYTGYQETRPVNMSVNWVIKY